MKTNIELCSCCANDGGTLNNMQDLIIPILNDDIQESKDIILFLIKGGSTYKGVKHNAKDDIVSMFRQKIVDNTRAIRLFYSRFPELKRTRALKFYKKKIYIDTL